MPGDDGARERSWRVVRAAYGAYEPPPRRRSRVTPALVVALMAATGAGVAAASAPQSDLGRWVRGVLGAGERDARPVLGHVPGGGRLLVQAGASAWLVSSDGAKRRLGAYAGTAWSPHGLFVVGWRGRELTAMDPGGTVRWSLAPREGIASARWAPVDGFRIAYVAGSELRIVNGDGSGDRGYGAASPRVAPAWRPDDAHVLAYADGRGRVSVVAVDARRRIWRAAPPNEARAAAATPEGARRVAAAPDGARAVAAEPEEVRSLAWSPSGRRLLVVTSRRLVIFDAAGRRLRARAIPAGFAVTAAEWSPRGGEIAVVRSAAGRSELVLAAPAAERGLRERVLFTGPGRFGAPAWSPGAQRLLLPWPDADQWLFLRPHGGARLTAVANIADQFGPGRLRPAFPRDVQWCC